MKKRLEGKVAIVTGASRGIGAAIAQRLAAEGARVAIVARGPDSGKQHFSAGLQETADRILAQGGECLCISADLMHADKRGHIVEEVTAHFGGVDILINNAAWAHLHSSLDESLENAHLQFECNVFGPLQLSQQCIPIMKARGGGWIVNLSSGSAQHVPIAPYPQDDADPALFMQKLTTLYGASKAALERMTNGMAVELASANIAVNALSPVAAVATQAALDAGVEKAGAFLEPVEAMVEATLELCSRPQSQLSGRALVSLPFLQEIGATVHTLDGSGPLADYSVAEALSGATSVVA